MGNSSVEEACPPRSLFNLPRLSSLKWIAKETARGKQIAVDKGREFSLEELLTAKILSRLGAKNPRG